jgi:hypothetical protein
MNDSTSNPHEAFVTELWETLGESPERWLGAIAVIDRITQAVTVMSTCGFPAEVILDAIGAYIKELLENPLVDTLTL